MRRIALLTNLGLFACAPTTPALGTIAPSLDDIASTADAEVDVVDRTAALAGATDAQDADPGSPLDFASLPEGALLDISGGQQLTALEQAADARSNTYDNVITAVLLAGAADLVTAAVVAPPAAAIRIAADGTVTEVAPNVWSATNSVSDGYRTVTGTLVVAWVGVGWLAEMRLDSSDGEYADTLWFNGFVAANGALGWWDLYTADEQLAGVVEWAADGTGNAEFGIAALVGQAAGDVLAYGFSDTGETLIAYHDASRAEDAWVYVAADRSGELRSPDYNGGSPACWAAEDAEAPLVDVTCPAE